MANIPIVGIMNKPSPSTTEQASPHGTGAAAFEVLESHSQAPLEAATHYRQREWSVIPVAHRSKQPTLPRWAQLRLTEADLLTHFGSGPMNIGLLTGEPSGWIVDIDLDHPRCVALADRYLPPTPAIFGRPGNPRSHRLYRVSGPVATKRFRSTSAGMLVELRSTGLQTVLPPSTHESGELITWEIDEAEPAVVDPDELLSAATELANATRVELGERHARSSCKTVANGEDQAIPESTNPELPDVTGRCLQAMRRMGIVDRKDGSRRLYAAACRCVEHDLDDPQALEAIQRYANDKPFPRTWSEPEVLQRIRDAERVCTRGIAHQEPRRDTVGCIELGQRDPESGRLVLSPRRTLPTAEAYMHQFHAHPAGRTLHSHAGMLRVWRDNRYVPVEDESVRHVLQSWLHEAVRYHKNRRTGEFELLPFDANPTTVNSALESIRASAHLPADTPMPSWLAAQAGDLNPLDILPCQSSLLHLPTMGKLPPTPLFFTTSALDYDYDPHAPQPTQWLRFLGQLFGDDLQYWDLLQEWLGYALTPDTTQHKMLLIIGPRRSGKGTLARVLTRLVGASNVCGPTASSLAGPFGLQPLIGKTLAIVSDARFSGRDIQTVIERLLCISGEDAVTVDRKHMPSVTMKLPTRFVFLTNELPRLSDASGALAGRFMMIRLTESFYGREDNTLTNKLLSELPGILNWAVEGWRQLRERGHFIQPASVEDALRDMEDLSSPVGAFVRERCEIWPELRVRVDEIYQAWKQWCEADGRINVTTKQTFGRDLMAAAPGLTTRQGSKSTGRFYQGIGLRE